MFAALLDTCVLWPSKQRDFLLSLAVLREQLDGAVGAGPVTTLDHDDAGWEAHRSRIEKAAREASSHT